MRSGFIYNPPQHPLDIIFEDHDLIVVDKPAGLLSVMGRLPEHQDSAYLRVLTMYPEARVTHRLDMATSGLLMFAKHRDAEVAISKLFQLRRIKKEYTALVQGCPDAQGCIEAPLITDWPNRPKQKIDFETGKSAKTLYARLEYCAATQQSRMRLEPVTGRSHQLRVHLMHIGHPILGDKLYHPQPQNFALGRMALHATRLSLIHPITGLALELSSTVPF
ncbi:pseudouridine synthase [Acinetobacter soli]|uniref:pseudouridine synthase n=1 Tax=Acinetobacter soli TaxID=487316 RepID=UPI000E5B8F25|nr:pseudouridine synthase [Acinetobacter soli]MBO3638884.1 RNA pseudouridine synthase [Acinetobacter soli]WEH88921.1 pseudouridine synthase [Acinetobacter soli]WEI09180.1 pseudouridine synthase [Acinetobacter soli]